MTRLFLLMDMDIAQWWPEWTSTALATLRWSMATVIAFFLSMSGALQALGILFLFNGLINMFNPRGNLRAFCFRATFTMLFVGVMDMVYNRLASMYNYGSGTSGITSTILAAYFVADEMIAMVFNLNTVFKISIPPKFLVWLGQLRGLTGQQSQEIMTLITRQQQEEVSLAGTHDQELKDAKIREIEDQQK